MGIIFDRKRRIEAETSDVEAVPVARVVGRIFLGGLGECGRSHRVDAADPRIESLYVGRVSAVIPPLVLSYFTMPCPKEARGTSCDTVVSLASRRPS